MVTQKWMLVKILSMDDSEIIPKRSADFVLDIKSDGSVLVQADCNHGFGAWSSTGASQLQFDNLALTRRGCAPDSIGSEFAKQLTWVRSYVFKDDHLYLATMADGSIIEFAPFDVSIAEVDVPLLPEEGGPLNWQTQGIDDTFNLYEKQSLSSRILQSYPKETVLDHLGCVAENSEIWCDVQALGGGPRGYVLKKILKPAVAPNGVVIKGPETSALRAGQGKFDAKGQISCTLPKQDTTRCDFQVARSGGGYATVVITKPDNRDRIVFFRYGRAIGASTSQAQGYETFKASKEKDVHVIHIGSETYQVPDAVIFGG